MKVSSKKKVVVHRGGTIKRGRFINVTRCRVAGGDVSVARAAIVSRSVCKFLIVNFKHTTTE